MNRLSVTFFQRHNFFFQFNVYVQKAQLAELQGVSLMMRLHGSPNQAEYHMKGNGHMRAHTQGRAEETRDDKQEALPEDLGPVSPTHPHERKRKKIMGWGVMEKNTSNFDHGHI